MRVISARTDNKSSLYGTSIRFGGLIVFWGRMCDKFIRIQCLFVAFAQGQHMRIAQSDSTVAGWLRDDAINCRYVDYVRTVDTNKTTGRQTLLKLFH